MAFVLNDFVFIKPRDFLSFLVADCSHKARVINTKKLKNPLKYRPKKLFSLFGFLGLNGNSVARQGSGCKQEDFLGFLKLIRKENPEGQLVIILDNAKIHKAKQIKKYAENNQIYLLYLPTYCPDLNPIEFLWKDVKRTLKASFYQKSIDVLSDIGRKIAMAFLKSRRNSYTKKCCQQFL